jgi:glutathione S-transferase
MTLRLHHYPSTASMAPMIVLEEAGVPYERVFVDRTANAHKTESYLKLNPNGLLPVLEDGDLVLYETAAICLYIAEKYPQSGLFPAVASMADAKPGDGASRAQATKWLMWLTNTLQATLITYFYPERWVDAGNTAGAAEIKRHAQAKVWGMIGQIDAHLAHGGPWFLGERYSLLDGYAMMLCRWTRNFNEKPARDWPRVHAWLTRVLAREAVVRVFEADALPKPWV